MNWKELIMVPERAPVFLIGSPLELVGRNLYRISETQYCLAARYNSLAKGERSIYSPGLGVCLFDLLLPLSSE